MHPPRLRATLLRPLLVFAAEALYLLLQDEIFCDIVIFAGADSVVTGVTVGNVASGGNAAGAGGSTTVTGVGSIVITAPACRRTRSG